MRLLPESSVTGMYDLSSALTTIASCSATFVAIIGGLIANKAISDSSEKESIQNQLKQINAEIASTQTQIDELGSWLDEDKAEDFIDDHLNDLLQLKPLADIYDRSKPNILEFDVLKSYWDRAINAVIEYKKVDDQEPRNSDNIPCDLAQKLDGFQYRICNIYQDEIENGYSNPLLHSIMLDNEWSVYRAEQRSKTVGELDEIIQAKETLNWKKEFLQQRYNGISLNKDIKKGVWTFAIISAVNIILPTIFMWFNPTASLKWYLIESAITYILFIAGVIIMIQYIYSLFPKKEDK